MLSKKLKLSKFSETEIIIKNKTKFKLENCFIKCSNKYGKYIFNKKFDIIDELILDISYPTSEILYIEVFEHDNLILSKYLNDTCIVTFSKRSDNDKTNDLISKLSNLTDIDVIKYTQNFEENGSVMINTDDEYVLYEVLKDSIKYNYKKYIYLSNKLVIKDIDFINIISQIDDDLIFNKSKEYTIGPKMLKLSNSKEDVDDIDTNVISYNGSHFEIFDTLLKFLDKEKIEDISKFEKINDNLLTSCYFKSIKKDVTKIKLAESTIDDNQVDDLFKKNLKLQNDINYQSSLFICSNDTLDKVKKIVYSSFESRLIDFYKNISYTDQRKLNLINIITHNVRGALVEINTDSSRTFNVNFLDNNNEIIHSTNLTGNMWTRLNSKYYHDYSVIIKEKDLIIYQSVFNLKNKRVYISLESSSLGDSLAWFPYIEEFRKKHDCHVIVSTFNNDLFIENYPNLNFIKPGDVVHDLAAMYSIGWFYDENGNIDYTKNPIDFRNQPLQKTASDILGLEYKEIKPLLTYKKKEKKKKVGIGIHGTAQSKYWNNPTGWQNVVDFLKELGYEVVLYSKESDGYMGNQHPKGIVKFPSGSLQSLIEDLTSCEFFVGIGSGLSWLAWSVDLPIVLISGFSKEFTETSTRTWRVINKNVCTGCFNTHKLDPSDWNWCPVNKGTEKQFECSKEISSEMVISKIKEMLKEIKD